MKTRETIEEMEAQHAAAYARIPSRAEEFEEWDGERVWGEHDEIEPEEVIPQAAIEQRDAVEGALERAAEIRRTLEGRQFSDSTHDVIEDRKR